jgi:hypothetical protein
MRVQKALCYGHNHYWAQAERRCLPTGRPAAARGRHPATGAGQGGAALLSSWRGLGRPGAATLPQARAERPELLCHRRAGVGGRPGPRRPAPSLPPSILRPAQWLCRPCPPPAAWRGPVRRLLDTKYSVAGKLLSYGIITGIRSKMLMWTVGSCCIEWLGIMF